MNKREAGGGRREARRALLALALVSIGAVVSIAAVAACTDVMPSGPARGKVGPGDVIQEIIFPAPRRQVRTVAELQKVVTKHGGDDSCTEAHDVTALASGDSSVLTHRA
jgi:hypothetical protein